MRNKLEFVVNSGVNYVRQKLAYRFDQPLNKPTQVTVSITDACAAHCVMCDIWKLQVKDELTADEWMKFLGQMREWLGPFWLVITGGEPFQKPGIFEILQFCRDHQIRTKMSSNGLMLRPTYLDRVLQHGPDFMSLSIDSPRAEVHDTLRGTPGLFNRCAEAIHYLRERDKRMVLGVANVIMEDNYRDSPHLVRWALEQGVDRVLFQPLQPNFASEEHDRDWHKKNPHWVRDPDALERVIDELLAMKRDGLPIWNDVNQLQVFKAYFRNPYTHPRPDECMVRYSVFNVDPHGNVNFCWTVNDTIDNIRNEHPAEIWRSQMAREVRGKMRPCRAPCTLNCFRSRSLGSQIQTFRFFWERQGF